MLLKHASLGIFYLVGMMFLPTVMVLAFGGPLGVSSIVSSLDEIIVIVMHLHVIYLVAYCRGNQKAWPVVLYGLYWLWNTVLILKNSLPLIHVVQIAISGQFFIWFIFYYYLPDRSKLLFIQKLKIVLIGVFLVSGFFGLLQLLFPVQYEAVYPVPSESRGVFGVSINSIFSSRVFFADFLLVFMLYQVFLCPPNEKYKSINNRRLGQIILIVFAFIFILLTGSRKELVFSLLILIYFFTGGYFKNLLAFFPVFLPLLYFLGITFFDKFSDINEVALSDSYVRWHIFNFSVQIISDYFPFGSGPGTFGSVMSISYQNIYDKYGVGENILGFDGQERGPIFDMYLSSSIAEIGLGVVFVFLLFYRVYRAGCDKKYGNVHGFYFLGIMLLFFLSIMTPILNNWIGFLLISMFGVYLNGNRKVNVYE